MLGHLGPDSALGLEGGFVGRGQSFIRNSGRNGKDPCHGFYEKARRITIDEIFS